VRLREADLSGAARGIAFQLCEQLGSIARRACEDEIAALTAGERRTLSRLGVHVGRESVYLAPLLKPVAVRMRGLLWAAHAGKAPPDPPRPDSVSFAAADTARDEAFYAIGFRPFRGPSGVRAIRIDVVERLVAKAYRMSKAGAFRATPELCGLAGCGPKDLALVLGALGYVAEVEESGVTFHRRPRRPGRARKRARGTGRGRRDAPAPSPFAKLRDLDLGR
jgi:ATP-dependent RNA helicase SUPV3L1/SUV3